MCEERLSAAKMSNPQTTQDIFDQLLERYSGEWEGTASRPFGNNFRALHSILRSSRMGSVTSIVIYGIGNGGTREEQLKNAEVTLDDDYLEYTQKVFFTQLAVARLIRDLIQERFRLHVALCAYDPGFTQHSLDCLRFMNVTSLTIDRDAGWWYDRGTLIYDVTKSSQMLYDKIDMGWQDNTVPPAAILTCATSVTRDYYLLPMMNLETQTAPTSAEMHAVEAIRDPQEKSRVTAQLREGESRRTRDGYERMLVRHNTIMDDFADRVDRRASELRRYYRRQHDEVGLGLAGQYAEQEMLPQIPRDTNSYVYDPMMVLLYRKPART